MATPVIQLEDYRKTYVSGEVEVHAVRGVTLTIQRALARRTTPEAASG